MPTYVYACKSCAHQFEKYQSFSEDSLRTCPECQQDALRKVFNSVGIVFKGSGFYSTDSAGTSSTSSTPAESGAGSDSGAGDASGKIAAPAADSSSTSTSAAPAAAAAGS